MSLQRQIGDLQARLNDRTVEVSELRSRLTTAVSYASPDHSRECYCSDFHHHHNCIGRFPREPGLTHYLSPTVLINSILYMLCSLGFSFSCPVPPIVCWCAIKKLLTHSPAWRIGSVSEDYLWRALHIHSYHHRHHLPCGGSGSTAPLIWFICWFQRCVYCLLVYIVCLTTYPFLHIFITFLPL